MIVRDHFLHDPIYHWHDVAEELPHAITQAMIFKPDVDMTVQLLDIGTLFTKPANYLPYLKGAAVYARDRWDIPVNEIRRLDEEEMKLIVERCEGASSRLYKRIATMSPRDRIMAGATTYYADSWRHGHAPRACGTTSSRTTTSLSSTRWRQRSTTRSSRTRRPRRSSPSSSSWPPDTHAFPSRRRRSIQCTTRCFTPLPIEV